jgi:hypothetical protein
MIRYGNSTYNKVDGIHILNINEKDSYHAGYSYAKLLILANHPMVKLLQKKSVKILGSIAYMLTKRKQKKNNFSEKIHR